MPPTVIVATTVTNTLLVQMLPVHGGATGGKDVASGDIIGELAVDGTVVGSVDEVMTEVKGSPVFEIELSRLALMLLSARLELAELALAALSDDKDDRTLRTELV